MDIKFSGFGGQGIIKSGMIIGKAASLYDNLHATLTQSFGPEARGSACSAALVVDESPVLYPYIVTPHILVSMSQEAYEKFSDELAPGGTLLIDADLVQMEAPRNDVSIFSTPATRIAEEMGNRLFSNVVMMGFFTAITKVVRPESVKKALSGLIPERFMEKNIEAFDRGYDYGLEVLEQADDGIAAETDAREK
ncbi:MAG: 2-oxoacid:acceptor oxidoreductase family protein [Candidatus Marinimicrobia bacterium]|nr:2-oxoacid:acceptor oxidoreductase family protein [Candidatus Neomarinimicrobiota bacterium]